MAAASRSLLKVFFPVESYPIVGPVCFGMVMFGTMMYGVLVKDPERRRDGYCADEEFGATYRNKFRWFVQGRSKTIFNNDVSN